MDLKALLEKIDQFAGSAVGQKPGDQVRGTEIAKPIKSGDDHPFKGRLVGASESVLKDLSKGPTPKTKEQELAEEFQSFLEAEFQDTVDKRPSRKGSRPSRGHEPKSGYKTVKADEGAMSEKDIELQDYRSMSHKEFQTAYDMTKTEWINKNKALVIKNPSIKKGLGLEEGVPYKTTNPHPASKDPIVAQVLKQMRPGLTGLDMNNEAFLYLAYELGKQRAREMWEDYGPAIKYFYQSDIGVNEGWESGPEEYQEPYDDADDAYERQRQEKIDTEAEKEWAKLPKVSTYKLVGRGPNMEPNYEFGDEFDTLEQAVEYRAEIMKDPKTPHPEHIGIRTITRVKDQTDEAIDSDIVQPMEQDSFNRAGYNPIRDERDYLDKLSKLSNLARKPGLDQAMKDHITQRILDLNAEARKKGYIQSESRGHTVIANKLKDVERAKKFASGELKIPTPQERQAQLAKQEPKKEKVDEYGATSDPVQKPVYAQSAGATGLPDVSKLNPQQKKDLAARVDPDAEKKAATAVASLKSATGSTASPDKLMKALDSANQGKSVDAQTMSALQPVMDVVKKAGTNPALQGPLKSLINQAKAV